MNIVIIGTGNVAVIVGKLCVLAGHEIKQVYGRNATQAAATAVLFNATHTASFQNIYRAADLYIVAVSDKAITEVAHYMNDLNGLVVHTSGGVSINALSNSRRYGVLYPMQSLRKEMQVLPAVPFFIDANTETGIEVLKAFAGTLSKQVSWANDEQRLKLHIGAVLCSNFTNYLYALTQRFSVANGIDFKNYLPLINETAGRLEYYAAKDVQTGPAIRKDILTIEKHMQVLQNGYPEIADIYNFLTKKIMAGA